MNSVARFQFMEQYKNMHVILDEENNNRGALWLGDYTAALDVDTLMQKNIRTVLTTAKGLNMYYPNSYQIQHHQWFMHDHPSFNISKFFKEVIQEIDEGLTKGGVLVHCAAGISRSASCVIAYLMLKQNMTYPSAINYVKKRRRVVQPNPGFLNQLQLFDKQIASANSNRKSISIPPKNGNPLNAFLTTNKHISRDERSLKQQQQQQQTTNQTYDIPESNYNSKINKYISLQQSLTPVGSITTITKPKNIDDNFIKNSMDLLKQKSHKFIAAQSDSRNTIRSKTKSVLSTEKYISVQTQFTSQKNKITSASSKNGSTSSIFDMLYEQQQLRAKKRPQQAMIASTPSKKLTTDTFFNPSSLATKKAIHFPPAGSYLNTTDN